MIETGCILRLSLVLSCQIPSNSVRQNAGRIKTDKSDQSRYCTSFWWSVSMLIHCSNPQILVLSACFFGGQFVSMLIVSMLRVELTRLIAYVSIPFVINGVDW